ncbi:GLEYA domain-containing protein [Lachancea thermotolerans]
MLFAVAFHVFSFLAYLLDLAEIPSTPKKVTYRKIARLMVQVYKEMPPAQPTSLLKPEKAVFLLATETYQLNLRYVDDLAYINAGAGNAFNCCDLENAVADPGGFVLKKWGGRSEIHFISPDGVEHETWENYIFIAKDGEKCDVRPDYTTKFLAEEPSTGSHTSTRITAYDGLETRKVTTTEYTITGEDGYRTAETLYYVETPENKVDDGIATTETVYQVETPEDKVESTIHTPWTGTFTTTCSTDVSTFAGSNGIATTDTETVHHVEILENLKKLIKYTPWIGSFTSTDSTGDDVHWLRCHRNY